MCGREDGEIGRNEVGVFWTDIIRVEALKLYILLLLLYMAILIYDSTQK